MLIKSQLHKRCGWVLSAAERLFQMLTVKAR